jgi:hypothetical protein
MIVGPVLHEAPHEGACQQNSVILDDLRNRFLEPQFCFVDANAAAILMCACTSNLFT